MKHYFIYVAANKATEIIETVNKLTLTKSLLHTNSLKSNVCSLNAQIKK